MAGYKLYGWRQTGSMAIEAALAEAAEPHEFIAVSRKTDANLRPEFTAILSHIADAFPQARLAPERGSSARATHDRWMAFVHANIYEGMLREVYADRYTADPGCAASVSTAATEYVRWHFQLLEAELGEGPYLFGPRLSMFDIYMWMLCYWVDATWLAETCPAIDRMRAAASARPALAVVLDRHFGPEG